MPGRFRTLARRPDILPPHLRDVLDGDLLGVDRLALAVVGAVAEAFAVHLRDHGHGPARALGIALGQVGELADLGAHEQRGRGVGARRHAGAAADARRGVHGLVRGDLGYRHRVAVGGRTHVGRHEAALLLDAVEGRAVHHQVLDDGERPRAERLHGDGFAVLEAPHLHLAGGGRAVDPVGHALDHQSAGAADTLAAVVAELDRLLALLDEVLVEDVQHLQEGHFGQDPFDLVVDEQALGLVPRLAPPDATGTAGPGGSAGHSAPDPQVPLLRGAGPERETAARGDRVGRSGRGDAATAAAGARKDGPGGGRFTGS